MDTNDRQNERRLKRWRLVLGADEADGIGVPLGEIELAMDRAISTLYEGQLSKGVERKGGLGASSPNIARWLGDIRTYFPSSVVRVMQQDALDKFNLKQLLLEPELLAGVEPDIHLVSTLIALKTLIPQKTRSTARMVVQKVVDDLTKRLASPTRQAITGSLNRANRNIRPRHNEIDWNRTIKANLKHYQAKYRTIIPEKRIGYSRKGSSLKDIILCIDQSGSMASSVVYAGVFGAVLASLPSVSTKMVAFDTSVVDLTTDLQDPVDLLFGVQLGGGTDINKALAYCQQLIVRPDDTVFVLISDLYEGGNRSDMIRRAASIAASGVKSVALLALSDDGAPSFDHEIARTFASIGIPAFACSPDVCPELMAAREIATTAGAI
jgi:Mg-chelatase subunit ChlD